MKFTLNSRAFADAMTVVGKVVERRNTYPILSNVFLAAGDGTLTLRATDLDIEITLSIDATVEEPGKTTVSAQILGEILRKFGKGGDVTATLDSTGQRLKVVSGRSRFELSVIAPDSFPDLKTGNFATEFTMAGKELRTALETIQFAISKEETRYYLNGVYMHAVGYQNEEDFINFVTTDGHRMAQCRRKVEGCRTMPSIILPRKTVGEVIKMAEAAGDDPIKIELSDTKIRFSQGRMVLLSKLIEGTYPDYERVTPKGNNIIARVDAKSLIACVDRVGTIASEKGGRAVKLNFANGLVGLEVTNPDHGTATDEVAVEMDKTASNVVGFNTRYLQDILEVIGKGAAQFEMMDGGSPTLITAPDRDDVKFVLMPMRV